jgi:hypothetical protein
MHETLKKVAIRGDKIADYRLEKKGKIVTIKRNEHCVVEGYSIGGEAPKSFIRVYEHHHPHNKKKSAHRHKIQRKSNPKTWTLYIAKTGHKWYPIESITEHLIARIGTVVGLNMAFSRLAKMDDQVRFLSRYFINYESGQELVHGTDILATYLGDRSFVEEIQVKKREKEFFFLETVVDAIRKMFPENHTEIIENYFLMLIFDAWVGVQDRHFNNWAVVRNIFEKHAPYFSPIYDSARGLFWNETEKKLQTWLKNNQVEMQVELQIRNSMPQVGLSDNEKPNHFKLIEVILSDRFLPIKAKAGSIFTEDALPRVLNMVETEFEGILSRVRINMIVKCLQIRYYRLLSFL